MMNFLKKNIMGCVLALMLVLTGAAGVFAGENAGSIELQLPEGYEGVEMTLYPVAQNVNGSFVCSGDFADSQIVIPDLNQADKLQNVAEQLAAYIKEKGITGFSAAAEGGGIYRVSNLAPALYMAVQTGGEDVLQVQKSFIPIPYMADESGNISYDAVVAPKYTVPEGAGF